MANYFVHESSFIDSGAIIGEKTKIWHFSHVSARSIIGKNCSLGQNVFVANNVEIGNFVKIQNNVSIYEGVILEDYVFCGPSMVFTNVKVPRCAYPQNTSKDYLVTKISYGASIGANATIVCGVKVGKWSFIGAGALVTKHVKNYALMTGLPAKQVAWICECGEKLDFITEEEKRISCITCGKNYKIKESNLVLIEN